MPNLHELNQEELAIFVAKQMENFAMSRRHHPDVPTNFKESKAFHVPHIARRHQEKAAEAGAANASSPAQQPQPFVTQQQATEAAPSSMKPAVYRPRPGRDVDRQALYNQWAFASPPHFYHQVPRQEAESKAASCAAVPEQLASKMEVPLSKAMCELKLSQDLKDEHKLLETESKEFEEVELEEDVEYELVEIDEDATFEKVENEEVEMGDWEEI